MIQQAQKWKMQEIEIAAHDEVANPFWEVRVAAEFSQGGETATVEGFYDGRNSAGAHTWKVRWTPPAEGVWSCVVRSEPQLPGLAAHFETRVMAADGRAKGFLRAIPGQGWGLYHDNGEPRLVVGDTLYNLFGAHYCGVDTKRILSRRKEQGVNYFRVRVGQLSSRHLSDGWEELTWPWGGARDSPDFTRLNLDYFRAVDEVMSMAESLEMGVEMIMESWLLDFPFNDRHQFLPEHEELWLRYLVARYSAFPSLYIWCPANEYEFYPGTAAAYHQEADRWFRRIARLIKTHDPNAHPIGAHNWAQHIPLRDRLGDCDDVDVYLVQTDWLKEITSSDHDASLCLWLETDLRFHSPNRDKPVICDEFGYERCPGAETVPAHSRIDEHHTRRGQWKAGFSGCHVVHGFNNTWGPHLTIEPDAAGVRYIRPYHQWITRELPLADMAPAPEALISFAGSEAEGSAPLCLANSDQSVIAVYFPRAGRCELQLGDPSQYLASWFDPRTGERIGHADCGARDFATPEQPPNADPQDDDWVLCLKRTAR